MPILNVLREVDRLCHFSHCFSHFNIKHSKTRPSLETILAGLMSKGCNIGVSKLASISTGINENTHRNTVNWHFSLKNIQSANHKILGLIEKLDLANAYKKEPETLHSSSDGRKVSVAVDSLLANYSYKYFGKDKGVAIHWDDMLRFMATIKLNHATASQLVKRLSSYAKDHLLYQALKEFGRINKSQYILIYLDDLELRQQVQK